MEYPGISQTTFEIKLEVHFGKELVKGKLKIAEKPVEVEEGLYKTKVEQI